MAHEPVADEAEKHRLLWQLAELFSGIAQEEAWLRQAAAAEEQLEACVSSLRHAVEHAEAELAERGQQTSDEPEERLRKQTSGFDQDDDDVPEEMLRELEDLHVEIENLQDRNEYLQLALQQANDALEHADDETASRQEKESGRTQAARQEVEELERELVRLKQREEKMVEEQRNRILEIQEELLYIEAQSRDERYAAKEEVQVLAADNEVLEAEIDGVKAGAARCIIRLEKEEQHLKEEVSRAKAIFESKKEMQSSHVQELERKTVALKAATEETQRLSDPKLKKPDRNKFGSRLGTLSPRGTLGVRPSGSQGRKTNLFDELNPPMSPAASPRISKKKMTLFDELAVSPRPSDLQSQSDLNGDLAVKDKPKKKATHRGTLDLASEPPSMFQWPQPSASSSSTSMPKEDTERQRISIGEGHQEMLTISLDPSTGASLGIGIDAELMITAVADQGLVPDWNGTHSFSSVSPGYKIVEVNGKTEIKEMIKQLKLKKLTALELRLQWKGSVETPNPKSLNRTNSRSLRRSRSSLMNSYNTEGVSRVNLDENEDAQSAASSDSGVYGGLDASLNGKSLGITPMGTRPKKLSIIGEDSTITGDGSNCSSSLAEDLLSANVEVPQVSERSSPTDATSKRSYSLVDEDERALLETPKQDGNLEVQYDALERMGRNSMAGQAKSPGAAMVVAMDSGDEDDAVSPDVNTPGVNNSSQRRSSLAWRYDHLDVGDAVATLAEEQDDELEI